MPVTSAFGPTTGQVVRRQALPYGGPRAPAFAPAATRMPLNLAPGSYRPTFTMPTYKPTPYKPPDLGPDTPIATRTVIPAKQIWKTGEQQIGPKTQTTYSTDPAARAKFNYSLADAYRNKIYGAVHEQRRAEGGPIVEPDKLQKVKKPVKRKSFTRKARAARKQMVGHYQGGGAVSRFMQKYPDFVPGGE